MPDSVSTHFPSQPNAENHRPSLAVVTVLMLALGGCEDKPMESLSSAPQQPAAIDPTQHPKGWYHVSQSAGRIHLRAHAAPRATLLKALGEAEKFAVHGLDSLKGTFTGTIETEQPAVAAQLIARKSPISLQLEWHLNTHQLSSVHVGDLPYSAVTRSEADAARATGDAPAATIGGSPLPASDDQAQLLQWQEEFGYAYQLLRSEDPSSRVKALDNFPARGAGLEILASALRSEPDPEVRIEYLHKLDESGSHLAKNHTLSALSDADSAVITTAVQLITEWHDEEVTQRHLIPLLQHHSGDVRAAVTAAINRMREQ